MRDPLQLIPFEKWSDLEEVLSGDWPRCIQIEVLDFHRKWTEQGIEYDLQVYCPYGDLSNGMISVNKKISSYEVIILYPKEDTEQLESALRTTKMIDWNQAVEVAFASENVVECLKKIVGEKKLNIHHITKLELFIIKRGSPHFDISLPAGLSFAPTKINQAEFINSVWPHQHPNSTAYIESLIRAGKGYGLYKNQDLIGWVFIRENGPLLHLYVVEEQRRNGYAGLLLKHITNVLMDLKKDCFAYCVNGNDKAAALYRKMKFSSGGFVYYCHFGSA